MEGEARNGGEMTPRERVGDFYAHETGQVGGGVRKLILHLCADIGSDSQPYRDKVSPKFAQAFFEVNP